MKNSARYEKQTLFAPIGQAGQKKLSKSRVGILGVGALGTNIANLLVRAGVGTVVLADRDRVELSNLQRQMLFSEDDVGRYKAVRAAEKLANINSEVNIEAFTQNVDATGFDAIFNNCSIIMDATDNFETRFLINAQCLKSGTPWVHSGVTASSGQSMLITPGQSACYGCLVPEPPDMTNFPSIHNSGIIAPTVTIMASISVATALKYLIDKQPDHFIKLFDTWNFSFTRFKLEQDFNCQYCSKTK